MQSGKRFYFGTEQEARRINTALSNMDFNYIAKLSAQEKGEYYALLSQAIEWVVEYDHGFRSDLYETLMCWKISAEDCFVAIKRHPSLMLRIPTLSACLTESHVWFGRKFAGEDELKAQVHHAYKADCEQLKDFDVMAFVKTISRPLPNCPGDQENFYYIFANGLFELNQNPRSGDGVALLCAAVELNPNPIYEKAYYVSLAKVIEAAFLPAGLAFLPGDFPEECRYARELIMQKKYSSTDCFEAIKMLSVRLAKQIFSDCLYEDEYWLAEKFEHNKDLLQRIREYLKSAESLQQVQTGNELMRSGVFALAESIPAQAAAQSNIQVSRKM